MTWKTKLETALTFIGLMLIGVGGLLFIYTSTHNAKSTDSDYIKVLEKETGFQAKETFINTYSIKRDIITIDNNRVLEPNEEQSISLYILASAISACQTKDIEVVTIDYLIDGKLLSTVSIACRDLNQKLTGIQAA